MAVDNEAAVLVELERLRGAVNTGFAGVNGRLDGIDGRTAATEQDVVKLDEKVDKRTAALEGRLSAVERRMWMAMGVVAVLAIGGSGLLTSMLIH